MPSRLTRTRDLQWEHSTILVPGRCSAGASLMAGAAVFLPSSSGFTDRGETSSIGSGSSCRTCHDQSEPWLLERVKTTQNNVWHLQKTAGQWVARAHEVIGKAGRQRWKGYRPVSRGIARNPVDHPNGGRTNGGKHWATPWGKPTKGKKTRTNKRTTKMIVRSRHDRKKS